VFRAADRELKRYSTQLSSSSVEMSRSTHTVTCQLSGSVTKIVVITVQNNVTLTF